MRENPLDVAEAGGDSGVEEISQGAGCFEGEVERGSSELSGGNRSVEELPLLLGDWGRVPGGAECQVVGFGAWCCGMLKDSHTKGVQGLVDRVKSGIAEVRSIKV